MSEKLIGSCIFGQSGGPTSVINASAYGAIRAGLDAGCFNAGLMILFLHDPADPDDAVDLATRLPIPKLTIPIIKKSWKSSRNTMSAISSITAEMIPWTPATRLAVI